MSKVLKSSPKKIVKKSGAKKSQKTTVKSSEIKPIRIVLEIVFKSELGASKGIDANLLGGVPPPTINYEFITNQITVLNLAIENKSVQKPGNKGSIVLDYVPPSGKISVSAMATGQGSGNLQLNYNGKNLFSNPIEFNFTNGIGFINETPKLP